MWFSTRVEGVCLLVLTRDTRAYLDWSLPSVDVINMAAGLQVYLPVFTILNHLIIIKYLDLASPFLIAGVIWQKCKENSEHKSTLGT